MDRDRTFPDRLRDLAAWFDATPAETAGLVLLLVGGLVLGGFVAYRARQPLPTAAPEVALTPAPVTVHVAGAVNRPGLLELPEGSRVAAAIAAAGGVTPEADLDALNLARVVVDGEQLSVPTITMGNDGAPVEAGATAWRSDGRLDLNRAEATDFEALPGIGPVLAGRIVAYREANGPFVQIGDLRAVPGIGEAKFQTLAELVAV